MSRFRQVLLAARRAGAYREALHAAGLGSPRSIAKLRSIEDVLQRLPCHTLEQLCASPEAFNNPFAKSPLSKRFQCPIQGALRAAVVAANFEETASVCVFDQASVSEIWQFGPDLIAAPLAVLLRWAEAEGDGLTIPTAHRAIVAFTGIEGGTMAESTRDFLWQVFEVPVFEQRLGSDDSVLAWECEAHEGLHVAEQNLIVEQDSKKRLILTSLTDCRRPMLRVVAGFTGRLVDEPCPCGQPGLRLCDISGLPPQELSATAAAGQCYG